MLVKAASLTAVVIYLRHWIHVSFLLLTSSVRQPPQNLWLHGWMATGTVMISMQKEQVIWSLIDWENLLLAYFSSLFFLSSSYFFLSCSSSSFFFSTFSFSFSFSSSSLRFFSSSIAAKFSNLKPIVWSMGTLLAVRSQISSRCFNYVVWFLPIFLLLMKVPLVLRSVILIELPSFDIEQCLPLSLLSLMQISQSFPLPTKVSALERE